MVTMVERRSLGCITQSLVDMCVDVVDIICLQFPATTLLHVHLHTSNKSGRCTGDLIFLCKWAVLLRSEPACKICLVAAAAYLSRAAGRSREGILLSDGVVRYGNMLFGKHCIPRAATFKSREMDGWIA